MEAVRWYVYSYSFHQTFYMLEKITLQETKFVAFFSFTVKEHFLNLIKQLCEKYNVVMTVYVDCLQESVNEFIDWRWTCMLCCCFHWLLYTFRNNICMCGKYACQNATFIVSLYSLQFCFVTSLFLYSPLLQTTIRCHIKLQYRTLI